MGFGRPKLGGARAGGDLERDREARFEAWGSARGILVAELVEKILVIKLKIRYDRLLIIYGETCNARSV